MLISAYELYPIIKFELSKIDINITLSHFVCKFYNINKASNV